MIALLASIASIAFTVAIAIAVSYRQSYNAESNRALSYARDVLHRADETARQIDVGFDRLQLLPGDDGCSDAHLREMQRIDLASSYIQAVGRVEGDIIVCGSLGAPGSRIRMGRVNHVQPGGVRLRTEVRLDGVPDTTFLIVEDRQFAAVIHKDLPIDVSNDFGDLGLSIQSTRGGAVLAARGPVRLEWYAELEGSAERTFVDGDRLVAVAQSREFFFFAAASLPLATVSARTRATAAALIPIGIVGGAILAISILSVARTQSELPAVIRTALRRGEFHLEYQPVVDLRNGKWIGAEALMRWVRPHGERVRPDVFIPAAEDAGLITRVTERVFELAARDTRLLFERRPEMYVAVNLSPLDLRLETIGMLSTLEKRTESGHRAFVLEVTERAFSGGDAARHVVGELRRAGARIAIDDFGTGYSSLSLLESLEVDLLKIDKSFVETMDTAAATGQVVDHIIAMARDLDLEIVAEGVETEEQARYLRSKGVHYAQGFYFSRPLLMETLLERLEGEGSESQAHDAG